MQHNWFLKSDIENFNANKLFLKNNLVSNTYTSSPHMVCFSHVPKTGGTSLESILFKNFKAADVLHVNAPDLVKQPDLLELKKNPPQLICGHHPMHGLLYQLIPTQAVFHFTQLRNPIDRVLSYYNYVMGKADHPMHEHVNNKSLLDFLAASPTPELSNGQSKRFSGFLHHGKPDDDCLYNIAKNTLDECFSLVLTTCLFDEGLLLLKNRLMLTDIYYLRNNVSKAYIKRSDLNEQEVAIITDMNQADIKLFAWAKAKCQGLIESELSPDQISDFKDKNTQWANLINS